MKMVQSLPMYLMAVSSLGMLSGCANYEVNTMRGNIPGYYIRYEMQEADRAVEAARQAGKDKTCPAEFKVAEDAKNNAYDVFRACHTEEGAALAKKATALTNALCPPQKATVVTPPTPAPVATPTTNISIAPGTIVKGETAKLAWESQNAETCTISPEIGNVPPQGSISINPVSDTTYSIVCAGTGGKADSAAKIAVSSPAPVPVPAPVVVAVQPEAAPAKVCTPTVIDIQFDTNKSDIKPKYHDELKKLADLLKEFPKATGNIEGYTDSVGNKESNIKLSQRRADSVRNYLIKNFGIAPERLGAKGFGPDKPIADNKTSVGKQKNRRIETNFICE